VEQSKRAIPAYLIVISGLMAVLGSLGFARFGYSMILPGMKDALVLTYTQMGLMASGNFTGYVVFAVLGGMLASRYGPRIVITLSLSLVGASMLVTGFVVSFPQALFLRSLTGVGSGGANVSAIMLPAAWFSARRRGLASGIIASGSSVGLIVTGFLVPKLNEMFGVEGWRYSWAIFGAITLVFALFCGATIRNSPVEVSMMNERSGESGWKRVGKDTLLWKIGLIYSMFGLSYVIYITFFGAYLVKEAGFTVESAGMLWALVGGLSLVSGPFWGHISDAFGRGHSLALVYFIQFVSFFLFAQSGVAQAIYTSVLLFGITAWSIPSILAAYSGDHFGPKLAFSVLGFLTLFFGIGQALGPSVAGYIADQTQTFTSAFLLSSSVAVLGGLMSLKILRKN
jgi:MFS family permease